MNTIRTCALGLLLLAAPMTVSAQTAGTGNKPSQTDQPVTVSVSADGVRFAAPGAAVRMRLEVFSAGSESVYDSGFQAGDVRDWSMRDRADQPLADGSYLCVVTLRGLSGRLTVKQGTVVVQNGQAALQFGEGSEAGSVEPDKSLVAVSEQSQPAATLTAHDGRDGQIVSTRGALTFRIGDFFGGRDREFMRLTRDGRLGIGTDDPQATLDVAGAVRARGGILFDDGTMLKSASALKSATSAKSASAPTQAASVGGVSPSASGAGTQNHLAKWTDNSGTLGDSTAIDTGTGLQMTVAAASNVDTNVIYTIANDRTTGVIASSTPAFIASNGPYFAMRGNTYSAIGGQRGLFSISAGNVASPTGSEGAILFFTGADQLRMFINPAGNVGVGTNNPQSKLDVAGSLNVTGNAVVAGNIAAKYQDVAEWVPARHKMAAGTVVVLDPSRTNGVVSSSRAYDTHVGGVVSAQPGVILGQGGDDKALVATTGRVRVKVDATRRPVRIGDLLVTSDREGMAMRSVPVRVGGARMHRPGTIIGKALEPLDRGTGEILVLLSLQ